MELSNCTFHKPGHWIASPDRDWASRTHNVLRLIEDKYITAAVALSMYKPPTYSGNSIDLLNKHDGILNRIYADSFVMSLDMIFKLIRILAKDVNAPKTVCEIVARNDNDFTIIENIRDSIAHLEDRGRGKGKGGKKISASVIVLSSFVNNKYGFTGTDGKQYYVELTKQTLERIRSIVKDIFNAYQWE